MVIAGINNKADITMLMPMIKLRDFRSDLVLLNILSDNQPQNNIATVAKIHGSVKNIPTSLIFKLNICDL